MTTYVMEARENFDPTNAALIDGGGVNTPSAYVMRTTDSQVVGTAFDRVRGKIMYLGMGVTPTNTSGGYLNDSHIRWDGFASYAGGATLNAFVNLSPSVAEKDVHTDAVVWHPTYDPAQIVPVSIINYSGTPVTTPGTWRRIGRDFSPNLGNNPVIVNPRNSDVFVHSESCELYQYRYADSFVQVISPYVYLDTASPTNSSQVRMYGLDATWTYNLVIGQHVTNPINFALVPSVITADEVTYDHKLAYWISTTAPFVSDLGVRMVLGTDANVYFLSIYSDADNEPNYRLTQFQPPAFATYNPSGNIAGGTLTDVTPWTSTTGPNLDGENYTIPTSRFAGYAPSWHAYLSFYRLPAVLNEAVAIFKFLKEQSAGSSDYTKTFFSCANLKLSGTPSFDYHSAFVTGYMTSAWATAGSIPVTGYAVLDYRELDVDLEQTDVVYTASANFSGDYTKRWLYFDVYPVVGSTVITAGGPKVVMVQYQFAYGSAPTVLQVIDEAGWDTAYAAYGTAIGATHVVEASLWQDEPAANTNGGYIGLFRDAGLTLGTDALPVWWWSGQVDANQDAAGNNLFYLNSAFTPRATYNYPTNPYFFLISNIEPPFLRLSLGASPPPPITQGHIF